MQAKQCRNCHALGGEGGRRGPALDDVATRLTHDQLIRQVLQGGGNMPAYGKNLRPPEVTALVAFLETLHPADQRCRRATPVHDPSPRATEAAPLDARSARSPRGTSSPRSWPRSASPRSSTCAAGAACVRAVRIAFAGWRLAAFLGGLGTLFVALASPLDTLADRFLAVHMAQHIVLMVVTPPLLLLGAPIVPLLHGLPAGLARAVGARIARMVDRLGHPIVGWLAMSVATWGWHVPAAFELAVRDRAWHVVEHASFLTAGLLFWWPVVQPWPSRARWPRWAMILYLLLADLQNTALAAILTFSDRVLYPIYGRGPRALEQQVVAGLLMWVPMALAYLVPAGVLTVRWLSSREPSPRLTRLRTWGSALDDRQAC